MAVRLTFKFDGGMEKWQRGLDKGAEMLKDWKELWIMLMDYFEHGVTRGESFPSPIMTIWESEGTAIGGNWRTSTLYQNWKDRHWQEVREYDVALGETKQILTGRTLYSLLHDDAEDAIRKMTSTSMEYGTRVDYAAKNQAEFKILDLFPEMIHAMDRILGTWVGKIFQEAGVEGEGVTS